MSNLVRDALTCIIQNLAELDAITDVIIVDTGAGISESVLEFLVASGEVLLVTTPEPTSITDSYSLLKALYRHPRFEEDYTKVKMVANRVDNVKEGQILFDKLNAVVTRYLKTPMEYLGCVPQDPQVVQAVMQQVPVSIQNPGAKSSQAYERIARRLCDKTQEEQKRRGMAAFFSHIIGTRNGAAKQSRLVRYKNMLSRFVEEGSKVELRALEHGLGESGAENTTKVYQSRVLQIQSEDTLEISMPMEQTRLILLPVESEYDMVFFEENSLYQCFARIVDRYKSNNVYVLVMELTSNLRKYQRREYYRFSCALDMCARNLEEEEIEALEKNSPYELQPGLPLKHSIIVDISGGGLRFMSTQRYEPGSLILCSYHLLTKVGERKKYDVVGKVLEVRELEKRKGTFEHRVQYYNLDVNIREEIIRFIFEEERKSRKKERMN